MGLVTVACVERVAVKSAEIAIGNFRWSACRTGMHEIHMCPVPDFGTMTHRLLGRNTFFWTHGEQLHDAGSCPGTVGIKVKFVHQWRADSRKHRSLLPVHSIESSVDGALDPIDDAPDRQLMRYGLIDTDATGCDEGEMKLFEKSAGLCVRSLVRIST